MKHLLSSTAFLIVNKKIAKALGLNAAILLSDLISKEAYFIEHQQLTEGWFFNTEANINTDTTLSPYQQRKALTTLKEHYLVEMKRKGIPAKQYFKINESLVIKFLNNLSATNLTSINKNKEIRIINKLFTIPTISEVEVYCLERKNNIEAESFINFYDSKGWMVGKNKMKDWRACIRTWEMREKKKPMKTSKIDSQINEYLKGKEYL